MIPSALFVRNYGELGEKSKSLDWYELLGCAVILRRLLMDAEPLVVVANRHLRMRIRFEIMQHPSPSGRLKPDISLMLDGIDPDTTLVQGRKRIVCNRDKRLQQACATIHGRNFTVRDIILYTANTAGAVHYESLPNQDREVLRQLDLSMRFTGVPPFVRQLPAIARVVLKGLKPLRDKLEAEITQSTSR